MNIDDSIKIEIEKQQPMEKYKEYNFHTQGIEHAPSY